MPSTSINYQNNIPAAIPHVNTVSKTSRITTTLYAPHADILSIPPVGTSASKKEPLRVQHAMENLLTPIKRWTFVPTTQPQHEPTTDQRPDPSILGIPRTGHPQQAEPQAYSAASTEHVYPHEYVDNSLLQTPPSRKYIEALSNLEEQKQKSPFFSGPNREVDQIEPTQAVMTVPLFPTHPEPTLITKTTPLREPAHLHNLNDATQYPHTLNTKHTIQKRAWTLKVKHQSQHQHYLHLQ